MEKVAEYNIDGVTVVKGQVLDHLMEISSSMVKDADNFQELLPNSRCDFNLGEILKEFAKSNFLKDEIVNEILSIEQHLKVLSLGSVDLFFLKKIKRIALTEFEYYECPFVIIETEDSETYLFSYRDNPNTTYCVCSEDDQKYNQKYECCGINCDWDIPVIVKIKMDGTVIKYTYKGEQHYLWN
ncbi:hypothetical protein AAGG74_17130 [Bacillus mexicanus]|uniref:hypothetical protein n=1 Tax=Bacillus mexicanus TaxID=2834415 RepID=UPI003D25CFDC